MTVLASQANAFPGGKKITIATWFRVPADAVLSLADSGRGAGFDMSTTDTPTGGSASPHGQSAIDGVNGFPISHDGQSGLIPIFEFGYGSIGSGQNTSFLYLTKCAGGMVSDGILTPGSPIRNSVMLQLAGSAADAFGIFSGESYFGPWVSLCAFGPPNDSQVPGWITDQWNVLIVSADVSSKDTYTGPMFEGHLTGITSVTQNTKIWMNLNSNFDTSAQNNVNPILTPSLSGGSNHSFYSTYAGYDSGSDFILPSSPSITMMPGAFDMLCRQQWAADNYNYAELSFAYTRVWFDLYIDPTPENYSKFFVERDGFLYPPENHDEAIDAFGPADIDFVEYSLAKLEFQKNRGTAGEFEVVGTKPRPYQPGPEEGIEILVP